MRLKEGSRESVKVLLLAVLIIYMILAAQFESLRNSVCHHAGSARWRSSVPSAAFGSAE